MRISAPSASWLLLWLPLFIGLPQLQAREASIPVVISTWKFVEAVRAAWLVIEEGGSAVDAVVHGCSTCENLRCDGSVGYGGSPDETGETTLDAMIMDGTKSYCTDNGSMFWQGSLQTTMNVGAVGALQSVKGAIQAARLVMDHTEHTLLVGSRASTFALSLGISGPTNLSTKESLQIWSTWKDAGCQPNYWRSVVPDSTSSCGPYQVPALSKRQSDGCDIADRTSDTMYMSSSAKGIGHDNHDTISMVVIDQRGRISVGTSTNGATHKIPGRIGDGPIVGAAGYADDDVGACGATGDGDVMMRFSSCYQVVESMRRGMSPSEAAKDAIARIRLKFPTFIGAVFALDKQGAHAGACHGWIFQYTVQDAKMDNVEVFTVHPDSI